MAEIVERTDGIPLFVEEMTKAVLEAESEGAARRTLAAAPSSALAVPASLHASLMARLDRLGQPRRSAQIGSAIGREFSHALLAVGGAEVRGGAGIGARASHSGRLAVAAGRAAAGELPLQACARCRTPPMARCCGEPRRALHARIAESPRKANSAEMVASQPEILLARHCTEAGLIEKAASLWGRAGQQSLARSALLEAEAQLARALDPNCDSLAGTRDSAPRADQATDRTCERSDADQGLRGRQH